MSKDIIKKTISRAERQLSKDSVLWPLIKQFGPCQLLPHKNYYQELVESVIGQQLSVKAAASINRRFVDLFDGEFPSAKNILNYSVKYLREAGLSEAKARYVQDIAQHVLDGRLNFDEFDDMSNDQIISTLVAVKGVGEWTAQMFLIFCMGRLDVLPTGDLGIKKGVQQLYGLNQLPSPDQIRQIANKNNWQPYESVASWYVWKSLDNAPRA